MFKEKISPRWVPIFFLSLIAAGCTATMSLEEAKKVSISMEQPSAAPSRHINDILEVLDQSGQYDARVIRQYREKVSRPVPSGADDRGLSLFYHERGEAARQLGNVNQALRDLRSSLEYGDKAGLREPAILRHLGAAEKNAGNYQKSVDLFNRALEMKDDMGTYSQLVRTYIQMGDLETAKELNAESTAVYQRKLMKKRSQNPISRDAHMNRIAAVILEAEGRYSEAEVHFRRELELYKNNPDNSPRGSVTARLGLSENLSHQNRLIEAEIEARQAITESIGLGGAELTAKTVMNLGKIMLSQRRIEDGERLGRAALRILKASETPADSFNMCEVLMFLGDALSRRGDHQGAMEQFDLAKEGMKENRDIYRKKFTSHTGLMVSLLSMNRVAEAMEVITANYDAALKQYGQKHPRVMRLLGLRGMAHALAGDQPKAYRDFSQAVPFIMQGRTGERTLGGPNRAILESYIEFLVRLPGTPAEREFGVRAADEAFRIASFLSGQTTQTALGESSARAAASHDPELSDLVRRQQDCDKQLRAHEAVLSEALMAPPDQQDPKALHSLRESIEKLRNAGSLLLQEINRRFPKYADFTSPQPVALEAVQKNLRRGESLIAIFSGREKTYVWAVPKDGARRFTVAPLGRKGIEKAVLDLRRALDSGPETLGDIRPFDLAKAYGLYEMLLKPLEGAWGDSKDLLVTVNGALGQLPLSLLPTEPVSLPADRGELFSGYRQVPWLVRKASITMLPSVNALITLRSLPQGDPSRKAFAGFGDPVFNREQLAAAEIPSSKELKKQVLASRGAKIHVRGIRVTQKGHLDSDRITSSQLDRLERLPDTSEELRSIARVLGADQQKDVYLGVNCSKQRIRTMNLADRKVVAFATHALLPGDLDGLDQPALALSSPIVTGDKESGLLTMDDILKLKLSADWVVLSACNTGAASGQGAEAVSGLGRAFFYAGSRALLVTMWPVETTSARKLVTGIFQNQKEESGLSRAQAMRRSMLNLIDHEKMRDEAGARVISSYAHPLFWAPFVVVGEPN